MFSLRFRFLVFRVDTGGETTDAVSRTLVAGISNGEGLVERQDFGFSASSREDMEASI